MKVKEMAPARHGHWCMGFMYCVSVPCLQPLGAGLKTRQRRVGIAAAIGLGRAVLRTQEE